MSLQAINERPLLPNQLDFQPLKKAISNEECCQKIEELVRQMIARGHGFYLIEAQEYLRALPRWFIDAINDDTRLNDFFSLLLATHNALSTDFIKRPISPLIAI